MDSSPPDSTPIPALDDAPTVPPSREQLAARLKALGHPVRLEVLATLARQEGCMCGEIVRGLPLAQSTVSEHLKVLTAAGLIAGKAEGQRSCYHLDKEGMRALKAELDLFFASLLAGLGDEPASEPD